jgi:predicted  nucleic acid-binding Zn-ribbon protein
MPSESRPSQASEIADVLNQNSEAAEQIKATASELNVVHAVLSTQIPTEALEGDLQAAVERTDELEQQLSETAEALEKSNDLLREIDAQQTAAAAAAKK